MMRDVNSKSREYLKKKPVQKGGLHRWIALGGDPKKYNGCQTINEKTVPGAKKS